VVEILYLYGSVVGEFVAAAWLGFWDSKLFCLLFVMRKEGGRGGIYSVLDRRKGVNHWVGGD
jgi:hypothetical protein